MAGVGSLKGLVSLVTGVRGLAPAVARRFTDHGAKVVLCDDAESKGEEMADLIGENCLFVPADVTSETDVQKALEVTKEKCGRLDVAICCTEVGGVNLLFNFRKGYPMEKSFFDKSIKFNVLGKFNVIRLAAGLMGQNEPNSDGQKGVIINAAHISGFEGSVSQAAYASSQGAILAMTLPLARDLSSEGIRVATVAIGNMDIPLHTDNLGSKSESQFLRSLPPFPKVFAPADTFAHLCQNIVTNPLINGEVIRMDGGMRQVPQIKVERF